TFRVFRGGDPYGGIVFTKDIVYLGGLLNLQHILTEAVISGKPETIDLLFSGRLAFSDLQTLEPYFDSGFIQKPVYKPDWSRDLETLAPQLLFGSPGTLLGSI